MPDGKYLVAALLVFVAKGDGKISEQETSEMMDLINDHFRIGSGESLALLTGALEDMAEKSDFEQTLNGLSRALSVAEKEDIALMMLKVVAANGRKDAEEMEKLRVAADIIEIPADALHRAYDRYFEETQT